MAVKTQVSARPYTPGKVMYFPEAASQSFKQGEFVYLVSGKVTVVPTTIPAQSKVLGMALRDATGTTNTAIPVMVCEPGVTFEMCVYHGTPASAITAVTQPGSMFDLTISSNKHYVGIDSTTKTILKIQALSPKDAVGDRYGRVIVEVLGSACQLSSVTS